MYPILEPLKTTDSELFPFAPVSWDFWVIKIENRKSYGYYNCGLLKIRRWQVKYYLILCCNRVVSLYKNKNSFLQLWKVVKHVIRFVDWLSPGWNADGPVPKHVNLWYIVQMMRSPIYSFLRRSSSPINTNPCLDIYGGASSVSLLGYLVYMLDFFFTSFHSYILSRIFSHSHCSRHTSFHPLPLRQLVSQRSVRFPLEALSRARFLASYLLLCNPWHQRPHVFPQLLIFASLPE